jgi:hypothetical protein
VYHPVRVGGVLAQGEPPTLAGAGLVADLVSAG